MTLLYILLAIVLLGVLIMAHEFGHFTAARLCGIAVKEFSIGFGPKLLQRKSKKHETVFTLRPIPLGGYCMFYGDTDDDPNGEAKNDPRNLNNAAVWKRILTVLAGPLMNVLLAFVVAIPLMAFYGSNLDTPFISAVDDGKPAQIAGLQAGDVFVSVNGVPVKEESVENVSAAIGKSAEGAPIELVVARNSEELAFTIEPFYSEADQRYLIGITMQQGVQPLKPSEVVPAAWDACVWASGAVLDGIRQLFTTADGVNQISGPVGTVQLVAQQTQQGGMRIFLYLVVLISINLGLMNLLPIPGLDGSRILFLIVEGVRRKPVNQRVEATIHLCGYAFLLAFMLYFTFKDVLRIFGA